MGRDYQRSTTTDHIADWDGTLLDANFSDDGKNPVSFHQQEIIKKLIYK